MYMEKFSRFFPDQETVDDWTATWAQGLAGLTGIEIKYGLDVLAKSHEWPPTMAEFRACCRSSPKNHAPLLKEPPHGVTQHAEESMAKIREILSTPKAPGNWWANEIMAKVAAGEKVTHTSYNLAKATLSKEPEREPGSDDEEIVE